MAGKKLAANVYVGGVMYEAGSTPPKEVADQIANPKAWADGSAVEADGYDGMKVPELKDEIARRNEGREEADQLSSDGNKADMVAALTADDES